MKISLATTPLLRILIPMVIGIVSFRFISHPEVAASLAVLSLLLYSIPHLKKDPYFRIRTHRLFNVSLFLLIIPIGWTISYVHQPPQIENSALNQPRFFNYIIDKVEQGNITTRVYGSSPNFNRRPVNILLTLQGNMYDISPGDRLCCYGEIERIKSPTMPESFDFASYMKHQGYLYSAHIKRNHYEILSHEESLSTIADNIKRNIIQYIHNLQLHPKASSFVITILTGDKTYITDDTRELFNDVGLAHILAVSGLHISIVALIISILLYPFNRFIPRKLRLTIVLFIIWLYTLITGFSPSATRAAIMTSFVLCALIFYKRNYVLNALCGSAIFTMAFNPSVIYDIGFQLSYLSVLGILFFSNILTFGKRNSWLHKISSTLALSLSAQIGALVISLYYFHTLPLSLTVSNIIIVPLLPLFMLASIVATALSYCNVILNPLNSFIDYFYQFIEIFTSALRSLPHSTIDNIWVNDIVVILYYLAFITICLFIHMKTKKQFYVYPIAGIVLCFIVNIYINKARNESGFILSDEYYSCHFLYYNPPEAFIINSINDTSDTQNFIQNNKRFFIKHNITDITILTDSFQNTHLRFAYPHISCCGKSIVFAQGNYRNKAVPAEKEPADYLVITKRYYNSLNVITKFYQADTIVFPIEIYPTKLQEFHAEAVGNDLIFYDMQQHGALIRKERIISPSRQ